MNAETQVAAAPDMIAATFTPAAKRIPIGSPLYNRILEAYYDEAAMLDELRFADWTEWLAEDLRYTAPQRLTRLWQRESVGGSLAERDRRGVRRTGRIGPRDAHPLAGLGVRERLLHRGG